MDVKHHPGISPENRGRYTFRHYRDLLWRKKWLLLFLAPISIAACIAGVFTNFMINPILPAKALIGFENAGNISAVKDIGNVGEGRAELISSRNFLRDIVKPLSLQMEVLKEPRSAIFDSIRVDSAAAAGSYLLTVAPDAGTFTLLLTNEKEGVYDRLLLEGSLKAPGSIFLPSIYLKFSGPFLASPRKVGFTIVSQRDAIERLFENLTVEPPDPQRGNFALALTVQGRDYPLITKCANTLADAFVNNSLALRNRKNRSAVGVLEQQLQTAREQLSAAEGRLRTYQEENPQIDLKEESQQSVNDLSKAQGEISALRSLLNEADDLLRGFQNAQQADDKIQSAGEILYFLTGQKDDAGTMLQSELSKAVSERHDLLHSYVFDHPLVMENMRQIEKLESSAVRALQAFIAKGESRLDAKNIVALNASVDLHSLPSKQLQLAELKRNQQIASDLYSSVLSRYNQARVADDVEMADVFILDYAVEPLPPASDMKKTFQFIALAVLIGLGLVLCPLLIIDRFDNTIRSEQDVRYHTTASLLETIPKMAGLKNKIARVKDAHKLAVYSEDTTHKTVFFEKGFSSEKDANIANEIFRSLCMKLLMKLQTAPAKSVVVTSLEPGAGKSTIAANIAIMMARQNFRTLLIDGDLHCGIQSKWFFIPRQKGLSGFLSGEDEVTQRSVTELSWKTRIDRLWVISSGSKTANAAELLGSMRFERTIGLAASLFDFVIFDAPPMGPVIDAMVVHQLFSRYAIVVRAGKTNMIDLVKKIDEFPLVSQKVAGLILNQIPHGSRLKYYHNSKYYNS